VSPFAVLGLPRSRTAWLSQFLTYGDRVCLHEPSRHWKGMADLHAALDAGCGLSDSVLTFRWRDILAHRADTAVVVVHRSAGEVLTSFRRAGLWHDRLPEAVASLEMAIDELMEGAPEALHVPYAALDQHNVCARVFAHCLGFDMPFAHWHKWRDQRVLADATQHIADAAANPHIGALFPELMEAA